MIAMAKCLFPSYMSVSIFIIWCMCLFKETLHLELFQMCSSSADVLWFDSMFIACLAEI